MDSFLQQAFVDAHAIQTVFQALQYEMVILDCVYMGF